MNTLTKNKHNKENKLKLKPVSKTTSTEISNQRVWWKDKTMLLLLVSLIVVTFIVLSPVLNAVFVFWDDDYNVFDNILIKSLSIQNIKTIFTTACGPNYNPLTTLSFAIEHYFFKLDPFYYHLHNLLLHLINTLLVFWFMMLIGLKKYWAFLVALLFGIHPMHVESVAWVTERKDVLFAMFYLASIIAYLYYIKQRQIKYLPLIYLCFLLSLLAKIQAVSLPLTLLAIDYLLKRKFNLKLIAEKVPYFLLSLIVGLIGIHFLKQQQSINFLDYTFVERILVGSASLCVYLFKAIMPIQLMVVHKLPYPHMLSTYFYIAPFVILLLGILVYFTVKHTREILFGVLFFLFNIVFLLQMVPAGNAYNAERFSYISYIGLFYIIIYAFNLLIEKKKTLKTPIISFITCSIIVLSFLSFTRAQQWKNTETLFTDLIEKYPDTPFGYTVRSRYYTEKNMLTKAIDDFTMHLKVRSDDHVYIKRGFLYFQIGDYEKALADYNVAIKQDPFDTVGYQNRGVTHEMLKHYDLALADYTKALSINPHLEKTIKDRAVLYNKIRQYESSIIDCNTLLTLNPEAGIFYNLRAVNEVELKLFDAALNDYNLALKYGFDEGMVYLNRSILYSRKGDKKNALTDATKAKSLGQNVPPGYIEYLNR